MASKDHPKVKTVIEADGPQPVIDALRVFTDKELDGLSNFIDAATGEFTGIGWESPGRYIELPTDEQKCAALLTIEEYVRRDWEAVRAANRQWAVDQLNQDVL